MTEDIRWADSQREFVRLLINETRDSGLMWTNRTDPDTNELKYECFSGYYQVRIQRARGDGKLYVTTGESFRYRLDLIDYGEFSSNRYHPYKWWVGVEADVQLLDELWEVIGSNSYHNVWDRAINTFGYRNSKEKTQHERTRLGT